MPNDNPRVQVPKCKISTQCHHYEYPIPGYFGPLELGRLGKDTHKKDPQFVEPATSVNELRRSGALIRAIEPLLLMLFWPSL